MKINMNIVEHTDEINAISGKSQQRQDSYVRLQQI